MDKPNTGKLSETTNKTEQIYKNKLKANCVEK